MNICVTGSSGFVGSSLCPYLEKQGHAVVCLNSKNADLTKQGSLEQYSQQKFDMIYHLAAWTQAGDFCLYHPGEQWIMNQKINTAVLEWWAACQPRAKLISIGTSCSYDPTLPHAEENYLVGTPTESLFTYAMTKRMLYVGLRALAKQFSLSYLVVVPSTLYGPGYQLNEGKKLHFIFDLITKIVRGERYDEPVVLWGDGYQKRELIYIDDFICAMTMIAEQQDNTLINIGGGEDYTIREFAEAICGEIGYDSRKIAYDTERYVGARQKFLQTAKLESLLPDFKRTPLRQGIAKTIAWCSQLITSSGR